MAKDPAFLFYPGDWIAGTMHLDFECKGAYMELLMLQFNRGRMTLDMVGHVLGQRYGHIWPKIQDKFQTDGTLFWNERLQLEKEKRKNFVKTRKNNISGKNQHTKVGHTASRMENENEDVNEIEVIGIKSEFSISIKSKYVGQKPVRIYDLSEYFKKTGQFLELTKAGLDKFDEFIKANPAGVFDDDGHVYHSFKKFHAGSGKTAINKHDYKNL